MFKSKQRWEYLETIVNEGQWKIEKILNDFGNDGWELVSAIQLDACRSRFYFKRLKR